MHLPHHALCSAELSGTASLSPEVPPCPGPHPALQAASAMPQKKAAYKVAAVMAYLVCSHLLAPNNKASEEAFWRAFRKEFAVRAPEADVSGAYLPKFARFWVKRFEETGSVSERKRRKPNMPSGVVKRIGDALMEGHSVTIDLEHTTRAFHCEPFCDRGRRALCGGDTRADCCARRGGDTKAVSLIPPAPARLARRRPPPSTPPPRLQPSACNSSYKHGSSAVTMWAVQGQEGSYSGAPLHVGLALIQGHEQCLCCARIACDSPTALFPSSSQAHPACSKQ